jgi:hypothetical protein
MVSGRPGNAMHARIRAIIAPSIEKIGKAFDDESLLF